VRFRGTVREADPDYLIIAPCGYSLERTLREVPLFEVLPGWSQLRAVRAGRVALADGNMYFNRSGTTIVETVEIIAEILHGHRMAAENHAEAWQAYAASNCSTSRLSV
jgi:iron complex transport system substrate-binding protein